MSFEVPLHSQRPEEGSITYLISPENVNSIQGFFCFTFYIRDPVTGENIPKRPALYLKGLYSYTKILKDVFANWKVLIYTDQFTFDQLKVIEAQKENKGTLYERETWSALQSLFRNRDSLVFAIVNWPQHQRRKGRPQVEGTALRPFRSRAPFDFPDKTIFIRDADTLFEAKLKKVFLKRENLVDTFTTMLYTWESTFYSLLPEIQEKATQGRPALIAGTGSANVGELMNKTEIYLRNWHTNELLNKFAPFGVFAGFINVTPNVPLYKNKKVWDEFVDYVNERSKPIHTRSEEDIVVFSNNGKVQSIGRDEQLYLFILLPQALENLVFFHVNLEDTTPPVFDEPFHVSSLKQYEEALKNGFLEKPKSKQESNEAPNLSNWFLPNATLSAPPNAPPMKSLFNNLLIPGTIPGFNNTKLGLGGGRRRKRKTLRLKFEKRNTRKRSK